ncbi:MAG: hypothetical protein J6M12_04110 [Clostridia bacterium]|nr:hypothetical protein [Clostridia bacterium]
MKDICFDFEKIQFSYKDALQLEEQIKGSEADSDKLLQYTEDRRSSFSDHEKRALRGIHSKISTVKGLIDEVSKKSAAVQAKKRERIAPPPRPSIPTNATAAQKDAILSSYQERIRSTDKENAEIDRQNARIDSYCAKCAEKKAELEQILSALYQLETQLEKTHAHTLSETAEQMQKMRSAGIQRKKSVTAMGAFCVALEETLRCAQRLFLLKSTTVKADPYLHKHFQIKNTHSSLPQTKGSVFQHLPSKTTEPISFDEEVLIQSKTSDDFIDCAAGLDRIRFPSAHLHRLGGKAFLERMNELGYTAVLQSEGNTIDSNGMIHLEKKNE